jgi:hypothetical protein
MSMKNSNDTIGNRSRDLPVCSAVPQPLRHRVPHSSIRATKINGKCVLEMGRKLEKISEQITENLWVEKERL